MQYGCLLSFVHNRKLPTEEIIGPLWFKSYKLRIAKQLEDLIPMGQKL